MTFLNYANGVASGVSIGVGARRNSPVAVRLVDAFK